MKKITEFIKESNEVKPSYMIKQQIESLKETIEFLSSKISGNEELDSWIESHITEAYRQITDVAEYFKNGNPQE